MSIINGVLTSAQQHHTTHFDARPQATEISLLVIHNISLPAGEYNNSHVESFFTGKLDCSVHDSFKDLTGLRVSAHCFIKRCGEVIQFVNFNDRAWHAGVSEFEGRDCCNDFSIGIELEGTDNSGYTNQQYSQLTRMSLQIMQAYPKITIGNICGHSDIAPGRKTDPGDSFDWPQYQSQLDITEQ